MARLTFGSDGPKGTDRGEKPVGDGKEEDAVRDYGYRPVPKAADD